MSGTERLARGGDKLGRTRFVLGIGFAVVIVAGIAMWLGGWDFTVRQAKTVLGWYPLRVTYEVTVEGEPVRIEQIIECYKRFDFSRYFVEEQPSWTQSNYFIAHRLKSGAWLGIVSGAICYRHEKLDWRVEDIPTFAVMWTASVDKPTVVHYYSAVRGYYASRSDRGSSHKIAIHTLKRNVQRLRWEEVDRPIAQDRLINGWFPWSHRRKWAKSGIGVMMRWGSGATMDKSVWEMLPGLSQAVANYSQPTAITLNAEQRRARRRLAENWTPRIRPYTARTNEAPELFGRPIPAQVWTGRKVSVPYRYLGKRGGVHRWAFDDRLFGVRLLWFTGKRAHRTGPKPQNGNTVLVQEGVIGQHRVVIGGKEFDPQKTSLVFDPSMQRVLYLGVPMKWLVTIKRRD